LFFTLNIMGFEDFLNTPIKVGEKTLKNRLVLSPMASLTTIALRKVISNFSLPGLLYTEMCLAKIVPTENKEKSTVFRWREAEEDILVCQIVGNEQEHMVKAAQRIEEEGLFGVDINMGCSISRLCKKGYGASLLREPDKAIQIVSSIRKAVNIPILVKFRTGWDDDPRFPMEFAKKLEDAGADGLIFHPRVAPDVRNRQPKWEYISLVKKSVSIPVFGNGNVFSKGHVKKMLDLTGCDGIALGRISAVRPWIFAEILDDFVPIPETFYTTASEMLEEIFTYFEPNRAVKLYKKWSFYFYSNFFYGHSLLKSILKSNSYQELKEAIKKTLIPLPKLNAIPNLNFLH